MMLEFEVPPDVPWLKEMLVSAYQAAEANVADENKDPKWASGYFAAVRDVIAQIEYRFAEEKSKHEEKYGAAVA